MFPHYAPQWSTVLTHPSRPYRYRVIPANPISCSCTVQLLRRCPASVQRPTTVADVEVPVGGELFAILGLHTLFGTVHGAQLALQQLLYSPSLLSAWLSLIPPEANEEGLANRQASRAHERLGQRAVQFSARLVELAIASRGRGPEQSMMDVAARGCDLDQAAGRAMVSFELARRGRTCKPRAWQGGEGSWSG